MESIRLYRTEEAEALFHVWQAEQGAEEVNLQKRINASIRARKTEARQRQRETRKYFIKQKAVAIAGIMISIVLAAVEPIGVIACIPFIGLFFTSQRVLEI